jgi:hypothetical protein
LVSSQVNPAASRILETINKSFNKNNLGSLALQSQKRAAESGESVDFSCEYEDDTNTVIENECENDYDNLENSLTEEDIQGLLKLKKMQELKDKKEKLKMKILS